MPPYAAYPRFVRIMKRNFGFCRLAERTQVSHARTCNIFGLFSAKFPVHDRDHDHDLKKEPFDSLDKLNYIK